MRVVGHLVKDLCLPSNWNAHVDWLSKTINCLAKLENVTLNFDHFPAIHSTEAIFWTQPAGNAWKWTNAWLDIKKKYSTKIPQHSIEVCL